MWFDAFHFLLPMPDRVFLILIAFVVLGPKALPAQLSVDSLKRHLEGGFSPAKKLEICVDLAQIYSNRDLDSSLYFIRQGRRYALYTGSKATMSYAARIEGEVCRIRSEYAAAYSCYQEALVFAKDLGEEHIINKDIYNSLGSLYVVLENHSTALEYYRKSLHTPGSGPMDTTGQIHALGNIGHVLSVLKEYDEALLLLKEGLALARAKKNASLIANSVKAIALAFKEGNQMDSARVYLGLAIPLFEQVGERRDVLFCTTNLLELNAHKGIEMDYEAAYLKVLDACRKIKDHSITIEVLRYLSAHYLKQKQYAKALEVTEEGLAVLKKLNIEEKLADFLSVKADALWGLGNKEAAYVLLDSAFNLKKESIGAAEQKQIEATKRMFELNQQAQIFSLEKQKIEFQRNLAGATTIFISCLAFIMFGVIIYWVRQNRKLRLSRQTIVRQRDELDHTNRVKDKIFALLSHDLRAPTAKGRDLLKRLGASKVPIQIIQHFEATSKMLENLLVWAKSQLNYLHPESVRFSLYEAVEDTEYQHFLSIQNKNLLFLNEVDPKLELVSDPEILKIILNNLFSNAIRHTARNGTVRVYAKPAEGGAVQISISDTGNGIAPEIIEQIRQQQLLNNPDGNPMQSGIGLLLSQELLGLIQGRLDVQSNLGKGSEFVLTIPPLRACLKFSHRAASGKF